MVLKYWPLNSLEQSYETQKSTQLLVVSRISSERPCKQNPAYHWQYQRLQKEHSLCYPKLFGPGDGEELTTGIITDSTCPIAKELYSTGWLESWPEQFKHACGKYFIPSIDIHALVHI